MLAVHYTPANSPEQRRRMATQSLKKKVQHEAYRIVFLQLVGVIVLALLALIARGFNSGFSVLAGGMAYGLPNLVFVWRVFRFVGAKQMNRFVVAFFLGEMMKLLLSAVLFLMIVKYLSVSLLSGLVGFVGAIVSFWVVCMLHFSKQDLSKQQGVAG